MVFKKKYVIVETEVIPTGAGGLIYRVSPPVRFLVTEGWSLDAGCDTGMAGLRNARKFFSKGSARRAAPASPLVYVPSVDEAEVMLIAEQMGADPLVLGHIGPEGLAADAPLILASKSVWS